MGKKWGDPLEKLLAADSEAKNVEEYISEAKSKKQVNAHKIQDPAATTSSNTIHEVDAHQITRWSGKDRPENEKDGVDNLITSFKKVGQQVPCILRPTQNKAYQYELIAGECRWLAAKALNVPLKAIIQDLDDRMAALVQAIENEQRNDLSDYAKGISYAKKISEGILTQKDLVDVLGISKQQVSRLISFSKIPQELMDAINDFRKVSARTAYELSRIGNKDQDHLNALLSLAERIKNGKMGSDSIIKNVNNLLSKKEKRSSAIKITSTSGQHLFTERLDNNHLTSYHLPQTIEKSVDHEYIRGMLKDAILKCIDSK